MPKTKICSTCNHQEVCGSYKDAVKMITNWELFDVKLTHIASIYRSMAEMCKYYNPMGATDQKDKCPTAGCGDGECVCKPKCKGW